MLWSNTNAVIKYWPTVDGRLEQIRQRPTHDCDVQSNMAAGAGLFSAVDCAAIDFCVILTRLIVSRSRIITHTYAVFCSCRRQGCYTRRVERKCLSSLRYKALFIIICLHRRAVMLVGRQGR